MVATHGRKPWSKFITPENTHLVSPEAIDLLVSDKRWSKQDTDEVLRVTGAAGGFDQGVHAARSLKWIEVLPAAVCAAEGACVVACWLQQR